MQPLSEQDINNKLNDVSGWKYEQDKLKKSYRFQNFKLALAFLVRVGFEAEAVGHHPEIFNVYNNVSLTLSTHDAGDKVTEKDFELAKRIDKITS